MENPKQLAFRGERGRNWLRTTRLVRYHACRFALRLILLDRFAITWVARGRGP